MPRLILWPYTMGSLSCKSLAKAIPGARRVYLDRNYLPYRNHAVVNWGNSSEPEWRTVGRLAGILNKPGNVRAAASKLSCLTLLDESGVLVPEFGVSRDSAEALFGSSRRVYCRTLTRASSGRGIIIANGPEELVAAPLYTAGIDGHRKEYRAHVFLGEVIDIVQKKKMSDARIEESGYVYSPVMRNHDCGWVFSRNDISPPRSVSDAALSAVGALGLDFGAVDLIVRDDAPSDAYCLEINTAPGLEGTTLAAYIAALERFMDA